MVGRLTGIVLTLVVIVCVTMIGLAGYLKYQLDRAEASLAAPEAVLTPDQEAYEKLRRGLGFGGYTGLAQGFAASHDASALPAMREQLKQVGSLADQLPPATPAETRHDVQSILDVFKGAQTKAEKSTAGATIGTGTSAGIELNSAAGNGISFGPADMAPLYAALPILDARVGTAVATNRVAAQRQLQFWAMLLTLVSWCSLIIAAALAAGIYLTLRDRNSAPLRALAQSVKNMQRGDMQTSIWGTERSDMVGELARAVDLARYQFSQLPDMSLLSDNGPVRLKFEGNTRSLFEAMMRVISRDSEQVHEQAAALTQAIAGQQEALTLIASRVEAVLHKAESNAVHGDGQVRQALTNMLGSAQGLKNAQEHAADQLNRIIPDLQARAQGMAEITQLTGRQVSQVLQSLTSAERGIKHSAEQSQQTIAKLSATADTLGERMFGAVNLLQASGKVLAETTDKTQARLDAAIARIGQIASQPGPVFAGDTVTSALTEDHVPRMAAVIEALESTQERLRGLLADQAHATRAQIDLLTTQSSGLLSQATTASHSLSSATDHLRHEQASLDQLLSGFAVKLNELGTRLETQAATAIASAASAMPQVVTTPADPAPYQNLAGRIDALSDQLAALGEAMQAEAAALPPALTGLPDQMRDHWYQMAGQIEATRSGLADIITRQIERIEARLAQAPELAVQTAAEPAILVEAEAQMEQQTQIMSELVATLGVLDAHMQEIRTEVADLRHKAG